ncbi:MAG: RNA polymerase sigma-70 factor (ECF subfamily) [Motiliproteus sp.]|jgi:RNA polymerase sigma-70 factor (ECF subfamily)
MLTKRLHSKMTEADWSLIMSRIATHRDRQAFTQLYDGFAIPLKSFLLSRGANNALAEDLLQACLLQVWEKAHLYNPSAGNLSTWLYRIVRNRYIDHIRRNQVSDRLAPPEWPTETEEFNHDEEEDQRRVKEALKKLPARQAQILYMSYYQGKTHSEIANELPLPLGSVKSSLRLAFKKLRLSMGASL